MVFFYNSLNEVSAFPFKNYLQTLEKFVKKAQNPIAQFVKPLTEMGKATKTHPQYSRKTFTYISVKVKDCCFILNNEDFAFVREKKEDGTLICDVMKQRQMESVFQNPCNSKLINVVCVRNLEHRVKRRIEQCNISRKAVCLPHDGGYDIMPLLHTIEK